MTAANPTQRKISPAAWSSSADYASNQNKAAVAAVATVTAGVATGEVVIEEVVIEEVVIEEVVIEEVGNEVNGAPTEAVNEVIEAEIGASGAGIADGNGLSRLNLVVLKFPSKHSNNESQP